MDGSESWRVEVTSVVDGLIAERKGQLRIAEQKLGPVDAGYTLAKAEQRLAAVLIIERNDV